MSLKLSSLSLSGISVQKVTNTMAVRAHWSKLFPTVSAISLTEAPGFLKAPSDAPANVAIAVSRLGGKEILKENGVTANRINFSAKKWNNHGSSATQHGWFEC